MDIGFIIALIFLGLYFYIRYKEIQDERHMRSGGSHFFNSKTNKPLSKKEFDKMAKEGERLFDAYLEEGDKIPQGWYENGQKKFQRTYKDGKYDGLHTVWYENGQKKEEQHFKDDKRDGLVTGWTYM